MGGCHCTVSSVVVFLLHEVLTLSSHFFQREFVECVEWSLQWLADRAGVTNRITRVYELESLIGELVSHSDADVTVSPFVVEEMLKTSTYEHDSCTR